MLDDSLRAGVTTNIQDDLNDADCGSLGSQSMSAVKAQFPYLDGLLLSDVTSESVQKVFESDESVRRTIQSLSLSATAESSRAQVDSLAGGVAELLVKVALSAGAKMKSTCVAPQSTPPKNFCSPRSIINR